MHLTLFYVSTFNSVGIQCTGIGYRYITGLWASSLRNEELFFYLCRVHLYVLFFLRAPFWSYFLKFGS